MKRLFMTFAAMLLMSVGAFAQSSETPLKGDVNEDGIVDVADITAIIQIMKDGGAVEDTKYYFSIGTTEVTASNYITANNATTTIPTTIEYTSTQRTYHYILVPSNKTLTMVDKNLNAPIPMTEQTSAGIPNHKLYKTNGAIASGATVVITLSDNYYWYVGTTAPTESNYTSLATSVNSYDSSYVFSNNDTGTRSYIYILVANNKSVTSIIDSVSNGSVGFAEDTTNTITGYKIYKTGSKFLGTMTINIK